MAKPNTATTEAVTLERLRELGWDVPDTIRPMTEEEFRSNAVRHIIQANQKDALIREDWAALVHLVTTVFGRDINRAWEQYRGDHE